MQTTPVIEQYIRIKASHQDSLLFFRMGDFYELFFEDAILASSILNIILTKRGKHREKDIPMCGVPHHSAESYIKTLLENGCKIAICEQMETPKEAKKRGYKSIVNRDVVRVISPGTLLEDTFLEQRKNNILVSLFFFEKFWSVCWIDISTNLFQISSSLESEVVSLIEQLDPSEILIHEKDLKKASFNRSLPLGITTILEKKLSCKEDFIENLSDFFSSSELSIFDSCQLGAISTIVKYLGTSKNLVTKLCDTPEIVKISNFMTMDPSTRRNLEINKSIDGDKKYSLLSVIDNTSSLMGSRLLSRRLNSPSTNQSKIISWQKCVKNLFENTRLNDEIKNILKMFPDTERSISRIVRFGPNPKDLTSICQSIKFYFQLSDSFKALNTIGVFEKKVNLNKLNTLFESLDTALCESVPLSPKEGNFIRVGYNKSLDILRNVEKNSKTSLLNLQIKYTEITKVKSLKIKYNNVLGYFIEVPISNKEKLNQVDIFIHRQTTANTIRYKSLELNKIESEILEASEKGIVLENKILHELSAKTIILQKDILGFSENIAQLDVFSSFAFTAKKYKWTCPKLDNSDNFIIKKGRHSVIEKSLFDQSLTPFVPNDCFLDKEKFISLITGPNMAGKSTFLRQNAHIIILSQIGSFVPAEYAHIGIVNKLFSRIGASDNISKGQSTFMVEMLETANILRDADNKSFIILDEIGRGTSTFDGLSIAWATLESLISKNKSRTLFATHYHELTEIEKSCPQVENVTCEIKEWNDEIIYSYKISKGISLGSLGIKVAELAGFPKEVLGTARKILNELESKKNTYTKTNKKLDQNNIISLKKIEQTLSSLDPNNISPKEALDIIFKLKNLL